MPTPANLVHQTTTGSGTGNLTLTAVNGKQSFATAFGTGSTQNVFDYFISNRDAAEWERGTGHMSSSTTLVRDTVIESTNSNAAVAFSAGTKDITNDLPALVQGFRYQLLRDAALFTLTASDINKFFIVDTSGSNPPTTEQDTITVKLPLASTCPPGSRFVFKKPMDSAGHAGDVKIQRADGSSDTIDNKTYRLWENPGGALALWTDGVTKWHLDLPLSIWLYSFFNAHHSISSGTYTRLNPYQIQTANPDTWSGQLFNADTSSANTLIELPTPNAESYSGKSIFFHNDGTPGNVLTLSTPGATSDQQSTNTRPVRVTGNGDFRAYWTDGNEYITMWEHDAHESHHFGCSLSSGTTPRTNNACTATTTLRLVASNNQGGDIISLPGTSATGTKWRWYKTHLLAAVSRDITDTSYGASASANARHEIYATINSSGDVVLALGAANAGSSEYTILDGVRVNAAAMSGGIAAKSARWVGYVNTNGSGQITYIGDELYGPRYLTGQIGVNTTPPTAGNATLSLREASGETLTSLHVNYNNTVEWQAVANGTTFVAKTTSNHAFGIGANNTLRFNVLLGLYADGVTGGDKGAGTANFQEIYRQNASVYYSGGTDVAVADGGTGASTAAAAATNLGLGTGDSPQFTAVNIGHATDTTITRTGAGDIAVEGNAIYRAGGTDVPVTDGGTGASTASAARSNLGANDASNLDTGTLPAGRLPALTGAVTSSAGSATTAFPSQNARTILGNSSTSSGAPSAVTVGAMVGWTLTAITSTNASWAVPSGTSEMIIEVWGPGASGAGGDTAAGRGGGGGSGAYVLKEYRGTMDSTLNITIGTGGAAVASAAGGADGNDGSGATTVVGTSLGTLSAGAGTKGLKKGNGAGSGGTATGGDLNLRGDDGYPGFDVTNVFGFGGTAPRGGVGGKSNVGSAGQGPGGGGAAGNHTGGANSGAGADGRVLIWTR